MTDTIAALRRAGSPFSARGSSAAAAYAPRIVEVNHLRVALLAFDATGPGAPRRRHDARRRRVERAARARGGAARAPRGRRRHGRHPRRHRVRPDDRPVRHAPRAAGRRLGRRRRLGTRARTSSSRSGSSTSAATAARRSSPRASATSSSTSTSPGRSRARCSRCSPAAAACARSGSARAQAPLRRRVLGWKRRREMRPRSATTGGRSPAGHAAPRRSARARSTVSRERSSPRRSGIRRGTAPASSSSPSAVPSGRTNVSALVSRSELVDRHGLTAHVGLYRPGTLRAALGRGHAAPPRRRRRGVRRRDRRRLLDAQRAARSSRPAPGAGAASASLTLPSLPGRGVAACADVDGRLDPVVLERSSR